MAITNRVIVTLLITQNRDIEIGMVNLAVNTSPREKLLYTVNIC